MNMQVKYYPDLFNDVYGPVMQAGSSSHTAAPCRIGYMARSMLGEDVARIDIFMDKEGSFAGTFGMMREDLGMLSGAYGLLPDDVRIFSIKELLAQEGVTYQFHFIDLRESDHINAIKFVLTGVSGKTRSLVGNSTGGGRVEIVRVSDYTCSIHGDAYVYLFEYDCKDTLNSEAVFCSKLKGFLKAETAPSHLGKWLLFVHTSVEHDLAELQEKLKAIDSSVIRPVLPVVTTGDRKRQLFKTFSEWIEVCENQNKSLSEVAIQYEIDASGWSEAEVIAYMQYIKEKMHGQTRKAFGENAIILEDPFSGFHYDKWERYARNRGTLLGPVLESAIGYSYAAITAVHGVQIVPGPMGTGGGIVYAVLSAVKEESGYSDEDLLKALFVAAGVGAIAYTWTNPTGEIIGCAGECGVCSAMAAAGVTYMRGGSPHEVETASSMALQSALGWPCDPIPGGFNQPCASRVVTAVIMAITFSDVALSGKDAVLPLHEVLCVADRIGREMPRDLRCTSKGGCCETDTGRRCAEMFRAWRLKSN